MEANQLLKDGKLDYIISNSLGNIAQYISLSPIHNEDIRYVHINNFKESANLDVKLLIKELINSSNSKAINIRSFKPELMKGNKLVYNKGIEDLDEILNVIRENQENGKYSILNENIDINDGGVSGVALGDLIEFAPCDTPKCVDKPDVCILPRDTGLKILETIYGFAPELNFEPNYRVEFSIHPKKQGVKKEHTIIWEYEYFESIKNQSRISWPNRFSKFIGDKVFGLLVAHSLQLSVPYTTVISRNLPPFSFGKKTGSFEKWIRTSPVEKEPGKYYTGNTWEDPFLLMNKEEAKGINSINISSILSQDNVEALYSGASIINSSISEDIIEGVKGKGDSFMVGEMGCMDIPVPVINEVKCLHNKIRRYYSILGSVTIEWVYDGNKVWIVQMNQIKVNSTKSIIVDGDPLYYEKFDIKDGLDALRSKIKSVLNKNIGIELVGNVGITSHFGDLLRLANIPSKIAF
ncbi:MAG: hypothetical protein ACRC77_08310 [Bacteroidales bacterium]